MIADRGVPHGADPPAENPGQSGNVAKQEPQEWLLASEPFTGGRVNWGVEIKLGLKAPGKLG